MQKTNIDGNANFVMHAVHVCLLFIHKLAGGGSHFITPYGLEVENLYSGARMPPCVLCVL